MHDASGSPVGQTFAPDGSMLGYLDKARLGQAAAGQELWQEGTTGKVGIPGTR